MKTLYKSPTCYDHDRTPICYEALIDDCGFGSAVLRIAGNGDITVVEDYTDLSYVTTPSIVRSAREWYKLYKEMYGAPERTARPYA